MGGQGGGSKGSMIKDHLGLWRILSSIALNDPDYNDEDGEDDDDQGRSYIGEHPHQPEREFNHPISTVALTCEHNYGGRPCGSQGVSYW